MKHLALAAGLAAGILLAPNAFAAGVVDEAGVPLVPADAAGPWTLESAGRAICVLKIDSVKAGATSFRIEVPASCGDALPAAVTGWAPSAHGMALVGADGQVLIGFGRWSNSLLVSHQSSGADVQLRRGG